MDIPEVEGGGSFEHQQKCQDQAQSHPDCDSVNSSEDAIDSDVQSQAFIASSIEVRTRVPVV